MRIDNRDIEFDRFYNAYYRDVCLPFSIGETVKYRHRLEYVCKVIDAVFDGGLFDLIMNSAFYQLYDMFRMLKNKKLSSDSFEFVNHKLTINDLIIKKIFDNLDARFELHYNDKKLIYNFFDNLDIQYEKIGKHLCPVMSKSARS